MAKRTEEQRLADLLQRKAALEEEAKKLRASINQKARKQRTSQLIRLSADLFTLLGREIETKDIILFHRYIKEHECDLQNYFNQDLGYINEEEFNLLRADEKKIEAEKIIKMLSLWTHYDF